MKLLPLAAALALACFASCSSLETNVDYDTQADFTGLSRYAWLEDAKPEGSINAMRVRRAVDEILRSRGYALDPAQPDFLVSSYVDTKERVQVTDHGYTYSRWGGWYGPRYTDVYQYTEGNLVIDLVDAKSRTLIWRGTASKVVDPGWDPERLETEIHEVVTKLLEDFPPK